MLGPLVKTLLAIERLADHAGHLNAIMEQLFEDWEILSCKTHYSWALALFAFLFSLLPGGLPDSIHLNATWTVRQKSTDLVKRVTADNKSEAADYVAKGLFDPD
jgi:hypothetical protein